MSLSKKLFVSLVLLVTIAAHSAVNYPYPQRKFYREGVINATSSTASNDLKTKFKNFIRDFYMEGNCSGTNDCARIRFDPGEEQYTVSEGIGYGMIMMVYFSDATDSYQTHFDKLWKYYQKWTNNNGVMHWKINGFNSIEGQNGATDAELDVALALAMAYYQFGGENYRTAARDLIGKIWQHEVDDDGLLKPGDAWINDRNPSYVSPAAFEIFKDLSTEDWAKVLTRNYTFLKNNQNANTSTATKLPSGWANSDGSPKICSNNCGTTTQAYDQDAVRAPWRWAWANAWYGHADAKTLLNNLAPWVKDKNPSTIAGPIALNGTMGPNSNSAYIGSLACALTNSSSNQEQLNKYWNALNSVASEPYFNQAMRLLTGLLITGNMPNLKSCTTCTDMGPTGGYDGRSTSIDKFADGDIEDEEDWGLAKTWEPWFAYTDVGSNGSSTIPQNPTFQTKDENDNCKDITSYRVVMKDGNNGLVATIPSYTLDKGGNDWAPYVALGLNAKKNGTNYNLSQCTGVSYSYKGQGHNFKVQTTGIIQEGSDYHKVVEEVSTGWTEVSVAFADLIQPSWTDKDKLVDFKATEIHAFIWELKGHDDGPPKVGVSGNTGSLAVKDFKCMGNLTLPANRPPLVCGGGDEPPYGNSSSSGPGGNSSSSGNTPITISKIANVNTVQLISNGVSLQVKNTATLEVFNIKGNSVRKMNFSSGVHSVNFSDLPKGLYIVRTKFGSHREVLYVPVK